MKPRNLATLSLAAFLALSPLLASAQSFPAPTAQPPAGNVPGPINVGGDAQVKSGGISVGSLGVVGGSIFGGNVGVGVGNVVPSNRLTVSTSAANDGIRLNGAGGAWAALFANLGAGAYNPISVAGDRGLIYGGASTAGGFVIAPWGTTGGLRLDQNGDLSVGAQDNNIEGGQIELRGAGTRGNVYLDNYDGNARLFNMAASKNLIVDRGIRAAGEIVSTTNGYSPSQLRLIGGNYGFLTRNDGVDTYFLLTNSGDQYGSWRNKASGGALIPLSINNGTGNVRVGTDLTVEGQICLGNVCKPSWPAAPAAPSLQSVTDAGASTNRSVSVGGLTSAGSVTAAGLVNSGFDFVLGNGDQSSRGNSGASRALVKEGGNVLVLNYGNDFSGGTRVGGNLSVSGNVAATGAATVGSVTANSISTNGLLVGGDGGLELISQNDPGSYIDFKKSGGNADFDGRIAYNSDAKSFYFDTNGEATNVVVNGGIISNYLSVKPQGGIEGGEIRLEGVSGSYGNVHLDNFNGNARIHTLAAGKNLEVLGGGLAVAQGATFGGSLSLSTNNLAGGGITISDDGGLYDDNDGWLTFKGPGQGIRLPNKKVDATQLCINGDCKASWPGAVVQINQTFALNKAPVASQSKSFVIPNSCTNDQDLYFDTDSGEAEVFLNDDRANKYLGIKIHSGKDNFGIRDISIVPVSVLGGPGATVRMNVYAAPGDDNEHNANVRVLKCK
jgi:hypothetical protein